MADTEEAEGASFEAAFTGLFGSRVDVAARLKAERKAGRTPLQRRRKATRTVQVNVRASPATKALLDALADHLTEEKGTSISAADVFEMAIAALAATHKVKGAA